MMVATERATFTVHINPAARRVIGDAIFERRRELGPLEIGGFLYALKQWPNGLEITAASGAASRPDESGEGALLDVDESFRVEDKFRDAYAVTGRMLCGSWHTHPPGSPGSPSDADKRHWLSMLDSLGSDYRGRIVGVIITADPHGTYVLPEFHAWTVRRQPHDGLAVCERAKVT